jgi:hypothetical protein
MAAKKKNKEEEPSDWYTGLHAFVFLDHAPEGLHTRDIVQTLRELPEDPDTPGRVIFASEFVGPYPAFAHVRVDDEDGRGLRRLQHFIAGPLWNAGARCKYATESAYAVTEDGKKGAKRGSPGIIGLVQIKVKRSRVDDVWTELKSRIQEHPATYVGASMVDGDFDILLQLGGTTLEAVQNAALDLGSVVGIVRSETALTDGSLYDPDPEPEPEP